MLARSRVLGLSFTGLRSSASSGGPSAKAVLDRSGPAVRWLLAQLPENTDCLAIPATGKNNRLTKADVLRWKAQAGANNNAGAAPAATSAPTIIGPPPPAVRAVPGQRRFAILAPLNGQRRVAQLA